MEFDFYIKDKDEYKKIHLVPPSGAGNDFFKSLRMTIDKEFDTIKTDMLSINPYINLKFPKGETLEQQEKIDKLVSIKRTNLITKEELNSILLEEDFIICESCGSKMYKTPVNVGYERTGNRYVLKDVSPTEQIKYVYMCENCVCAVSENYLEEVNRNLKLREKLIAEGESFVPGKFGEWSWINHNKKTKPSFMLEDKKECDHSWKREFTYIKVPGHFQPFVKITETCPYCKKVNTLK